MYFLKVFLYIYDKYRLSPSLTGSAGTCNFLQLVLSDLTSSFISQLWGASFESFPGVKLKNSSLITSVTQEAPAAITSQHTTDLIGCHLVSMVMVGGGQQARVFLVRPSAWHFHNRSNTKGQFRKVLKITFCTISSSSNTAESHNKAKEQLNWAHYRLLSTLELPTQTDVVQMFRLNSEREKPSVCVCLIQHDCLIQPSI